MNTLQSWLIVGVPGLSLVAGLFAGHVVWRAQVGYVLLAAMVVWFVVVPSGAGGIISAAVIGIIGVALIAVGRGTAANEGDLPEHHENRKRFTTATGEG